MTDLPALARQLALQRSTLPPQRRPLVSNLVQQIYNYDANPDAMRPRILETIEAIEKPPKDFSSEGF